MSNFKVVDRKEFEETIRLLLSTTRLSNEEEQKDSLGNLIMVIFDRYTKKGDY